MRYLTAILVLAILVTTGLGYSGSAEINGTEVGGGATVASVVLIDAGGDEVRGFKPSDNPQRFKVIMSKAGAGKVTAVFTGVDIGGEKNIKILQSEVVLTKAMNTADFSLELPNNFPVGEYKIDVSVNEKFAKTVGYTVK
jgi:hypothetical protein